jgi:hypothetical protein
LLTTNNSSRFSVPARSASRAPARSPAPPPSPYISARVDQPIAELEGEPHSSDFFALAGRRFAHAPGAEAEGRQAASFDRAGVTVCIDEYAESSCRHRCLWRDSQKPCGPHNLRARGCRRQETHDPTTFHVDRNNLRNAAGSIQHARRSPTARCAFMSTRSR